MSLATTALITVAQAGAFCKLDAATITADTDLLEGLILAATTMVEDYTGRAFITRTNTETYIGDGSNMIMLRKRPVTDVASITIDGTALGDDDWEERLSIARVYYDSFDLDSEIVIVYDAGYGTDRPVVQALVPQATLAVKMLTASLYENPEGVSEHSVSGIGSAVYDKEAWKKIAYPLKVNVLC